MQMASLTTIEILRRALDSAQQRRSAQDAAQNDMLEKGRL